MNELIRINYNNERPTVSGRELHGFLDVKTAYKDWFPRMCDYGFQEGIDFCSFLSESTGGRPATDHQLTIDMAKELCMIQRTEKGKQARQFFIQLEKDWNSPEKVMARALQIANKQIENLRLTTAMQEQQISELKPKADYTDRILQSSGLVNTNQIAKDYGMSARSFNKKLHSLGVQYSQGGQWLLYSKYQNKSYTSSETFEIEHKNGTKSVSMRTKWTQKGRLFIYELLKSNGILPLIEKTER